MGTSPESTSRTHELFRESNGTLLPTHDVQSNVPLCGDQAPRCRHRPCGWPPNLLWPTNTRYSKGLQILLKNAGIPFVGPVDGYIGRRTVRAFQTFLWANGVNCGPVDGRLGKRTIQGLQSWLAARGHYVGPIDGKLTENTVK